MCPPVVTSSHLSLVFWPGIVHCRFANLLPTTHYAQPDSKCRWAFLLFEFALPTAGFAARQRAGPPTGCVPPSCRGAAQGSTGHAPRYAFAAGRNGGVLRRTSSDRLGCRAPVAACVAVACCNTRCKPYWSPAQHHGLYERSLVCLRPRDVQLCALCWGLCVAGEGETLGSRKEPRVTTQVMTTNEQQKIIMKSSHLLKEWCTAVV